MKKTMLALRKIPAGEEYYEMSNERGAVLLQRTVKVVLMTVMTNPTEDCSNDLASSAVQ